jgi:subtilisin-like proprotein convertase family protein
VEDLTLSLRSPTGTIVVLSAKNGGSGQNYTGTVFDDEATASITTGAAPFTGPFQPQEALSAFDGEDQQGTWALVIYDDTPGDGGSLVSWSLEIENDAPGGDRDGDGVPDDMDAFPDDPSESNDNDGDGIGDNADPDDDNDGLLDVDDPNPLVWDDPPPPPVEPAGSTLMIGGVDSGVLDLTLPDGTTFSQAVAACAEGANNKGQFVRCVNDLANAWKKASLISGRDKGRITDAAAKCELP